MVCRNVWKSISALIVAVVFATASGCGSAYPVDLDSANIDYGVAPAEKPLWPVPGDIEKKKDDAVWVFSPKKSYEIAGLIIGWQTIDQPGVNILAGSAGIVWGKPAIELALQADGKRDDARLSDEAKAVLDQYGCPAGYLTQHTLTLMTIGASDEIDGVLRRLREGDGVYMKGMIVAVKSATYKGANINLNVPITHLYVTELRVGEKTYVAR